MLDEAMEPKRERFLELISESPQVTPAEIQEEFQVNINSKGLLNEP